MEVWDAKEINENAIGKNLERSRDWVKCQI
jgi:hypothetical protein